MCTIIVLEFAIKKVAWYNNTCWRVKLYYLAPPEGLGPYKIGWPVSGESLCPVLLEEERRA